MDCQDFFGNIMNAFYGPDLLLLESNGESVLYARDGLALGHCDIRSTPILRLSSHPVETVVCLSGPGCTRVSGKIADPAHPQHAQPGILPASWCL